MMRRLGVPACCGLFMLTVAGTAGAARPSGQHVGHAGLELPGGRLDRGSRLTSWIAPPSARLGAWRALTREVGVAWASWDQHTGVPSRIVTGGVPATGTSADPTAAEAFARDFLRRHIDLLAPGAAPSDFVAVTNELSHGIRSVGFVQHHRGRPVLGGQVSFRFKRDRLVVIGSEAFPDVSIAGRTLTVDAGVARGSAQSWLADDGFERVTYSGPLQGPLVLPIVHTSGVVYREVFATELETEASAGRFVVYVDAATGAPVARQDLMLFGTAQLRFNVPQRNPAGPRVDAVASQADGDVSGEPFTTATNGSLEFTGAAGTLVPKLTGPLVDVINVTGPVATASFPVADGATVVWNEGAIEENDAQLSAFVHASVVKAYVRNIDPGFGFLDEQLPTRVNDDEMKCNASWNGFSINFFLPNDGCENTALLADVVYHEFGHAVHTTGLIPGVGFFDGALSEGVSDYLGATMTGDPGVGRGFYLSDEPLRQIDPEGFEYRWPDDRGEVHAEGRIIGGALWDLRKRFVDKFGQAAGVAYTDLLYYETHRRAVNIPSMYVEALLFDDDDGNLANGTPNACEINAAYGPHGLFSPGEDAVQVTLDEEDLRVQLFATIPSFPQCPVEASPVLQWRLRDEPDISDAVPMIPGFDGTWDGFLLPPPEHTVLEYQVHPNYSTGTAGTMPDNFVDPWYQTYVGPVTELYCTSTDGVEQWGFEGNWAVGGLSGDANDPSSDWDGDGVAIHQPGSYEPFAEASAHMPRIDVSGFPTVRLQFRRWLTVEDGFFDQAFIEIDGQTLWENYAAEEDFLATFHHTDREWRFVDYDITEFADDGQVEISFGLRSDQGLHFGGWSLDEVCVVGVGNMDDCGNGVLDAGEECDDGNLQGGDGCNPACRSEGGDDTGDPSGSGSGSSGSGSGGSDSTGDTDGAGDTDGFDPSLDGAGLLDRGCACSSGSGEAPPVLGLLLLSLLGLRRRSR